MVLCLLASFFLFVAIAWQAYDTFLATYHLVKTGPGPKAEMSRMNASMGGLFIMMSAQWGYVYQDILKEYPLVMIIQMVIHLDAFVLTVAIISHVWIGWKPGAWEKKQ